jgi:hypothetical protein
MPTSPADEIATRGSCATLPLGAMQSIPYKGTFSPAEFSSIRRGLIAREMEDRWFAFLEGDSLFFHRSWTGHCVYQVNFEIRSERVLVVGAMVAADEEFYRRGPDTYEAAFLDSLIRVSLLHQAVLFPTRPTEESS